MLSKVNVKTCSFKCYVEKGEHGGHGERGEHGEKYDELDKKIWKTDTYRQPAHTKFDLDKCDIQQTVSFCC
jgi:hypothetical protein